MQTRELQQTPLPQLLDDSETGRSGHRFARGALDERIHDELDDGPDVAAESNRLAFRYIVIAIGGGAYPAEFVAYRLRGR